MRASPTPGPSVAIAAALLLSGCSKCGGGGATAPDAAVTAEIPDAASPSPRSLTGIDLRTAVTTIFPEYRGARPHGAKAWVARVMEVSPGNAELKSLLEEPAKQKGFTEVTSESPDRMRAIRKPFELEATRSGAQVTTVMAMRLSEEDVGKLFGAPTTMGSEQLAFLSPKPPGAKVLKETFVLELAYAAKPDRANFLIRQMVEGMIGIGWKETAPLGWPGRKEDGGVGDIPLKTTVTITKEDVGASIAVTRNAGEVHILYTQPLTLPER